MNGLSEAFRLGIDDKKKMRVAQSIVGVQCISLFFIVSLYSLERDCSIIWLMAIGNERRYRDGDVEVVGEVSRKISELSAGIQFLRIQRVLGPEESRGLLHKVDALQTELSSTNVGTVLRERRRDENRSAICNIFRRHRNRFGLPLSMARYYRGKFRQ